MASHYTTEFCCVKISPGLANDLYKIAPLCEHVDCSFKRDTDPINAPGIAIVTPPSLPAPTWEGGNLTPDCVPPLLCGVI